MTPNNTTTNDVALKACPLPDVLEGYWTGPEGREMAERCLTETRADLGKSELCDMALANAVFMVDRYSLELIHYTTAAKERIRWLSAQLAAARTPSPTSPDGGRLALALRRVRDALNAVDYDCGHFITGDNLKIMDVQMLADFTAMQKGG